MLAIGSPANGSNFLSFAAMICDLRAKIVFRTMN